jgi:hypothetical protein
VFQLLICWGGGLLTLFTAEPPRSNWSGMPLPLPLPPPPLQGLPLCLPLPYCLWAEGNGHRLPVEGVGGGWGGDITPKHNLLRQRSMGPESGQYGDFLAQQYRGKNILAHTHRAYPQICTHSPNPAKLAILSCKM